MRLYDLLDLDMYELQTSGNMSRQEVRDTFKTLLFYEGYYLSSAVTKLSKVRYELVKRKFKHAHKAKEIIR